MTYGEIKRRVLEHINRATINGADVPAAYNGHSDDLLRIRGLINEAVTLIRTRYAFEVAVFAPKEGEAMGKLVKYPLPEDFYALYGTIYRVEEEGPVPFRGGKLLGSRHILLPAGAFLVEYKRYPDLLPEDPEDDYEYAQDPEVLDAAAYFAAAHLAMAEDEFLYTALLREYEARLARMAARPWTECGRVKDAYGGEEA